MKKKVIILATGGTIAGVGEEGKIVGYKSGSIKVNDLIDARCSRYRSNANMQY